MIKSNGGIIGPDNVTTGGAFGTASGVFKLGEVTNLIKESKWPTAGPQGFQVANSCRFDDGSSTQMNKTISSTSTTWTFSCWIKLNPTGTNQYLASWDMGSGESLGIGIEASSNQLFIYTSSTGQAPKLYDGKLRDPGAWMNIVIKNSSGTITSYINGTQVKTSITGTALASGTLRIGCYTGSNYFYDGYMSEVVLIDGTAYNADSFGEFNSQTGIWVPKDVSGLTFGSDGFYLDFKDSANLGNDANGGTDLTEVNLTSIDQSTDTCSTNFATMNPLENFYSNFTFSEGNLSVVSGANGYFSPILSTIGIPATSGKWYCEVKFDVASTTVYSFIGITGSPITQTNLNIGGRTYGYAYIYNGQKYNNNSGSSYGNGYVEGDIIGIAVDATNSKIYFSKNGTWQNSGNPESGSTGTGAAFTISTTPTQGFYFFGCSDDNNGTGTSAWSWNFGSPPFAISSGNTDANGFGNFEYAVPTGYLSLNTKNLAAVLA